MTEKKEGFWEILLKMGAIIGGAWILASLLRAASNYKCPVCGGRVFYREKSCPSCGVQLSWGGI